MHGCVTCSRRFFGKHNGYCFIHSKGKERIQWRRKSQEDIFAELGTINKK